jgi:sec-independent protein translocase protein TatB
MFDIGFSEILLVAVVALVVIGPERLPGVARSVGRFAGRMQRYVHDIKSDFNREVELEEIRRLQHEMENTVQSMQESMRVVESSLQQEVRQTTLTDPLLQVDQPAAPKAKKVAAPAKDSEGQPVPKDDQLNLF